jgi:ApbE superfamily uncharacterized protein (UPF0280 family)
MIREHFQYRSTITTILADDHRHVAAAKDGMVTARQEIEGFIARDPFFAATFEPYSPPTESRSITRMVHAAQCAGVGPMAAVAGTIAWAGLEAMVEEGAVFGVIDNGGDIALVSDREIRVGIHAGEALLSDRIAFIVPPQPRILGICTSSATVGHSISLGIADAVTVFSRDVSLADAWATSLCNHATSCNDDQFSPLANSAVDGVCIIIGERLCRWGTLPPIVPARVDERLITEGR